MATPTPDPKKRKLSTLNGILDSSSNNDHTKVATLKLVHTPTNGEVAATMQTPPTTDPNPKLTEFANLPPVSRPEPTRTFEIGELAKLSLLSGPQAANVIVKIHNHALPQLDGAWQYCLKADSIVPGGTGVIWVDENNLQKVNYLDISQGSAIQFTRGEILLNGVVKEAKMGIRPKELVYEVEYACTTVVGMRDIVKVTRHGFGG